MATQTETKYSLRGAPAEHKHDKLLAYTFMAVAILGGVFGFVAYHAHSLQPR